MTPTTTTTAQKPFLATLYTRNIKPLNETLESLREEEQTLTTGWFTAYNLWLRQQWNPRLKANVLAAQEELVLHRHTIVTAERAVLDEELMHQFRQEDCRATFGVPDLPNFHYAQEATYRSIVWNRAWYYHLVAVALAVPVFHQANQQVGGVETGDSSQVLRYFNGNGVSLAVQWWQYLNKIGSYNSHDHGALPGWATQIGAPDFKISARGWMAASGV